MLKSKRTRSRRKKTYTDSQSGKKLNLQDRLTRLATGMRASREFKENRWKMLETHNNSLEHQHESYTRESKLFVALIRQELPSIPQEVKPLIEILRLYIADNQETKKKYDLLKEMYDEELTKEGLDEEM